MAFITVRNAEITSVYPKGFTLTESYTSRVSGEVFSKVYKVWTDEQWEVGTTVNVSGIHSTRLNEGEIEVHINKPRIENVGVPVVPAADAPF